MELTNDAKLIGRTAWELMRTLACPPEELRGIGLQMQRLENAGAANGVAGAGEGQGVLTFKTFENDKSKQEIMVQPSKEGVHLFPNSPIVVGDSSSPAPGLLAAPVRPTRSRAPVNYIDVSSSDAGDAEDDFKILSQAPANVKNGTAQSLLKGMIVKRSKSASKAQKEQPIVIPATSPAAASDAGPTLASPTKLSDKQLYLLGLDSAFFRSSSRAHQLEILRECLASKGKNNKEMQDLLIESGKGGKIGRKKRALYAPVFEQAAADKAKKEEAARRRREKEERKAQGLVFYKLRPTKGPLPKFAGKRELEDIRTVLGQWIEGVGTDHAPALEEVEDFASFCLRSISRDPEKNGGKGPDVAKINDALRWWKYLIDRRKGTDLITVSQRLAAEAWKEAYSDVSGRVSKAVEQQWGGPLACGIE